MGRGVFRFIVRSAEGPQMLHPQAATHGAITPEQPQAVTAGMELMRQVPSMSDRDEVIFLLHTAAEIEHSLLAEYLYAAYSLDTTVGSQQAEWRTTLLTIAREEMAHLLSVQNLLRVLGGPLNFEREDYPFSVFYPFQFQLDPFSLRSIARYVLAEMPKPSDIPPALGFDVNEVKHDAGVIEPGEMVNRVGALFTLLTELVGTLIDQPDFRPEAVKFQARRDEGWTNDKMMILELVNNKAEAKSLVESIGRQGEGPGDPGGTADSHFRKFFRIYTEIKAALQTNPADAQARVVPVNPTTQAPAEGDSDPNYIAASLARAWADLFNTRYRILLADLAHILTLSVEDTDQPQSRGEILGWIFNEMNPNLATIAETLATSPRHDPPQFKNPDEKVLLAAGAPFTLPYTLQLPDQPIDRWRQHELLLTEAALRIATVRANLTGANVFLDSMSRADEQALVFAREQIRNLSEKKKDGANDDDEDEGGGADENFVSIGSVEQFPVNSVHKITVEGDARVLYHADPTAAGVNPECPFYVSQLYCWHRHPETHPTIHCELNGTGVLSGKVATCATAYKPGCAHGSKYDITSGQVLQGPANRDLIMYATKREGDELLVSRTPISPDNA